MPPIIFCRASLSFLTSIGSCPEPLVVIGPHKSVRSIFGLQAESNLSRANNHCPVGPARGGSRGLSRLVETVKPTPCNAALAHHPWEPFCDGLELFTERLRRRELRCGNSVPHSQQCQQIFSISLVPSSERMIAIELSFAQPLLGQRIILRVSLSMHSTLVGVGVRKWK
jgi:hypothetical protein